MSNAVTTAPNAAAVQSKKSVKSWLESPEFKVQVARVLPRHITPDRFLRVALTAALKTPKLLQCTTESLTQCLLQCSQFGLEPDGRRAHLIPFEDRKKQITICTLIIDYKGLVELAIRSGLVSHIHADVIREGDLFEYSVGEIKQHIPWFLRRDSDKPAMPGDDIGVYAFARMKDGSSAVAIMSNAEVYSIRDNSQGWKAFKAGLTKQSPWDSSNWVSEQEMKKKTALRRLTKVLPLSPEFRDAVEADDDEPVVPTIDVTPRTIFGTATTTQTTQLTPPSTPEVEPQSEPQSEQEPESAATQTEQPQADDAPKSPQELLEILVSSVDGATFETFKAWAIGAGFMKPDAVAASFGELGVALCTKLLKNPAGLQAALRTK